MNLPDFSGFKETQFQNLKTGSSQTLKRASEIAVSDENLKRLVSICNESLVYDFLFQSRLQGEPYDELMARSFLSWATKGWTEKTHYVFLVTDINGQIDAALDIKSNDLQNAEIGYWCSSKSPGVVSNAVGVLCIVAQEAGYKRLLGLTLPENERSMVVLKRNHFSDLGTVFDRGKHYRKFSKVFE